MTASRAPDGIAPEEPPPSPIRESCLVVLCPCIGRSKAGFGALPNWGSEADATPLGRDGKDGPSTPVGLALDAIRIPL